MGKGYSQTEEDPMADAAYYIREYDDGPFLSRGKRRKALTKLLSEAPHIRDDAAR